MKFKVYTEIRDAFAEGGIDHGQYDLQALSEAWPSLRKALLAGVATAAVASPFLLDRPGTEPAAAVAPDFKSMKSPNARRISERMKDEGEYYDAATERRLRQAAEKGDEWAMREVPWPRDHRFYKLGRPFSRNGGPHPQGLFPNAGY